MGKGVLKSIAKGITAPVKFVGKIHRETFRIIDQGLEKANAAIEKTGFNKILGGSSVGVSTSSGASGGSNVYFKPAGSSNSVGIGLSNSGDASLFVNNNVAVPLTTPKANFITTENVAVEYSDNNTIKNQTDTVSNALAERDQLLREIYGPGYIPESSLATIGVIAISSATNQLLHDTWDTANTIANVNLNNQVIIHSMNEIERADAWNRNQEIYGNVSNAVSNVCANPAIIPEYYTNRFEESSNIFSSSLESGNLIGAGNAMGQTIYDSYIIASTVTGATALTAQTIKATNNFVTTNNFRSPLVFTFDESRFNSGFPLDQIKPQNPVIPKDTATHVTTEYSKQSKYKPSTRAELHKNLVERGFTSHKETPRDYNHGVGGGIVTYNGPDGRTVTIKETGEVIMVQKKWTADGLRKYPERQDFHGDRLLDQSHSTGHFVEPYTGPHKPTGPGL